MPRKGYKQTEEHKRKISIEHKKNPPKMAYKSGNIPWIKDKHHTEKLKERWREMRRGSIPWNKDKPWNEEIKKKMSEAAKGREPWNRGIKASEEAKRKMSESSKGQKAWNKGLKGAVTIKPETRHKLRIIHLNRTLKCIKEGGRVIPFYNPKACKYFKQFDKINSTEGQYATNGGELCILGYWLDYINHDKKLIIEWDEERHHYVNGKLREKDIIKQKEIEAHFSGYTFIRIRESKYIPKIETVFSKLVG